jgi:hypothetical protein
MSEGDLTGDADRDRRELAETLAALKHLQSGFGGKGDKFDAGVAKLPGRGEWVKAAPGVAIVCSTLVLLAFLAVFVALAITGTPTDTFFRLINLFLNALGAMGVLATLTVAMIHARRQIEHRKATNIAAEEAHRAVGEAHRAVETAEVAASAATETAKGLNGDLDLRIVKAVRAALDQTEQRSEQQDQRSKRQDERGEAQDERDERRDNNGK